MVYWIVKTYCLQRFDIAGNISPPSSGLKSKSSKKLTETDGKLRSFHLKLQPVSDGSLLGIFFGPQDGGDMFLQYIGLSPNYTALQPRKLYTSSAYIGYMVARMM
jgi:hypothetical protein